MDAAACVPPRGADRAADVHAFIERLPHTLQVPPQYALRAPDAGEPWQVRIMLAPPDQAALDALRPSAYQLCAAAQHGLGLAAIGSQIHPEHWTVTLHAADAPQLAFVGACALWWVANASPALLRALLKQLAAQIGPRDE
jgi:hypothetical protein